MTKICVCTANVGGIDPILGMGRQTIPVDYFYYDENNLPFPLTNLNNRMKAKYIKLQMHRFLPGYDTYIWVDGRIKPEGLNFVENYLEELGNNDIALYHHRERDDITEEYEFIFKEMMAGSDYLLPRYGNQQLMKELMFLKESSMPKDFPLFMGGFFIRKNNQVTNDCFDEWWRRSIEFSVFDQGFLSYSLWKFQSLIKVKQLVWDKLRTYKHLTITSHLNDKKNEAKS